MRGEEKTVEERGRDKKRGEERRREEETGDRRQETGGREGIKIWKREGNVE